MELENIEFDTLESITNNKSIGDGGYSTVHKGVYNGKTIAVKLFREGAYNGKMMADEDLFKKEIMILSLAAHPNVVQLIGTCNVSWKKHVEHKGKSFLVDDTYRALCFEYLEGGDLDKHLNEESRGHEWPTRYRIIRGICEGLNSLHTGRDPQIFHLDLKPANILLDECWVPKIADFGLATLSSETEAYEHKGTPGYMPPEAYFEHPQVTEKYDVYSLGVIILQIISGRSGRDMLSRAHSPSNFVERVVANWGNRSETTEADIAQVRRCVGLAIRCLDDNMHNRPTAAEIVDILDNEKLGHQDIGESMMMAAPPAAPPPATKGKSAHGNPGISVMARYAGSQHYVELMPGSTKPSASEIINTAIRINNMGMMRPAERRKKEQESGKRWTHKRTYDGKTDVLPRISRE